MYEVNSLGVLFVHKILDNWEMAEEYGRQTVEGKESLCRFFREAGFRFVY